jgi:hypothetical protein
MGGEVAIHDVGFVCYLYKYNKVTVRRIAILCFLIPFICVFSACKKDSTEHVFDYRTLGASANELLSSAHYSKLHIEIQYMIGYAPDTSSVNKLVTFLNKLINKPNGIVVTEQEIPANASPVLSISDVVSLEKRYRTYFTANDMISVHILITNGYSPNDNILATAYWNTSYCIYGKAVSDNSDGYGEESKFTLISTILEHEFGHLMGLVDQGSPMQNNHRDIANGAHCNNPDCLMYYNVETTDISGIANIPPLDANCLSDLKANGSK